MQSEALISWLLAAPTPSIRYLTLRRLLDLDEIDPEVQAARQAMRAYGPIPILLEQQTPGGNWQGEHSYYTPKYKSTHWSMQLLEELQTDPADLRLPRGAGFMLTVTRETLERYLENRSHGYTCLWANMLRYCLHSGMAQDPRVGSLLETLIQDALQTGWRCRYNYDHPCPWGAGRALFAMAALPERLLSPAAKDAIQSAISYLLVENHLLKADYYVPEKAKLSPLWQQLNFPLFYQADILLVLRALAELDRQDAPGAAPALEWLQGLQRKDGRWWGSSPFRQRTWRALGDVEETHRWISLQAAMILKQV